MDYIISNSIGVYIYYQTYLEKIDRKKKNIISCVNLYSESYNKGNINTNQIKELYLKEKYFLLILTYSHDAILVKPQIKLFWIIYLKAINYL